MNVMLTPHELKGKTVAPSSKSYAHRYIIAACLSGKKTLIKNVGFSEDVLATIRCMKAMGADCELTSGCLKVKSFSPRKNAVLDCGESGSTLRFLLPIAAALGVNATFIGSEKLLSRPLSALKETLINHGITFDGFKISGRLSGDKFTVDGSVSSQYVTGLLFALAILERECELEIVGNKVSGGYVNITLDVLKNCGIKITETKIGYKIFPSKFLPNNKITIEGDYSGAAFMLSAGAIKNKVCVKGLNACSKQGDRKIIDILSKFGASVKLGKSSISVRKNELNAITYDCEDVPDLVQIISVVAAFSKGETVLKNVGRLKYKESDRIKAITDMLGSAKIDCYLVENDLHIIGGFPCGGKFFSNNDHRTAMSSTILACYASGNSIIEDAGAVKKSYPDFYSDLKSLGGKFDVDI